MECARFGAHRSPLIFFLLGPVDAAVDAVYYTLRGVECSGNLFTVFVGFPLSILDSFLGLRKTLGGSDAIGSTEYLRLEIKSSRYLFNLW
jgi:hypothetical protein